MLKVFRNKISQNVNISPNNVHFILNESTGTYIIIFIHGRLLYFIELKIC